MWQEAQELAADSLVKFYEGLRLDAYVCDGGKLTIGYGSTRNVKKGMTITRVEAEARLLEDLAEADAIIDRYVKADLNINQRAALISWVFNLGGGNLKKSTLLKKLNKHDYKGAADEFLKWVYAGGKKLNGLVKRRKAERELFLKPVIEKPIEVKVKQAAPPFTTGAIAGATAIAPLVPVGKEVVETAENNPTGLIIVVLMAIILIGGYLAYRKIQSLKEVRR